MQHFYCSVESLTIYLDYSSPKIENSVTYPIIKSLFDIEHSTIRDDPVEFQTGNESNKQVWININGN